MSLFFLFFLLFFVCVCFLMEVLFPSSFCSVNFVGLNKSERTHALAATFKSSGTNSEC